MTAEDVLTSGGNHPERVKLAPPTTAMVANASVLADRCNRLFARFGQARNVTSGYRTPDANSAAGGAQHSHHLDCSACDLEDRDGALGQFVLTVPGVLEDCELWAEDPRATPDQPHLHVQIVPPGSGNRVFQP